MLLLENSKIFIPLFYRLNGDIVRRMELLSAAACYIYPTRVKSPRPSVKKEGRGDSILAYTFCFIKRRLYRVHNSTPETVLFEGVYSRNSRASRTANLVL